MTRWLYGFEVRLVNSVLLIFCFFLSSAFAKNDTLEILMLGDSLTAGYGLPSNLTIPKLLERKIKSDYPNVNIINGGVSGDTSAGGLSRLDWLLGPNIKAIIIELGANDGLRGINPSTTYSNLDQIIRKSKEFGLQVILTGMLAPPNLGPAYGDEFNRIYPDLAQKYDLIFFPFFLDGVVANPELNQEDGIHPNKYGVEVIAEKLNPYLRKLIGALRK